MGFDFLISQRLLLHPSYGVVQVDFQIPQFKTNNIYPPKHERDVNHFSTPVLTHTCIPVTCKYKYDIPPRSSLPILVNIDYPSDQPMSPDKSIVISSECLQDVDNWKSLSVFFQLLPSQDTGTIIYTNTTDDTISLAPNLVIACATFCFYPEQIDASVNIGNAPALSYIHAISQELSSLSFRDQVSTSSGIRDRIGFDVPIEQSIPTIDFAQVSMGSSDPAERKFVESLIQKHRSIISTSQWDLGLFNVSPAHISV